MCPRSDEVAVVRKLLELQFVNSAMCRVQHLAPWGENPPGRMVGRIESAEH